MNFAFSQLQINKQQIRQSVLMLLLFCATLFVHSEHYGQVESDALSNFEQHDCHLCQQGIDSPPRGIELRPVSTGIATVNKADFINAVFIAAAHVYPPLRAPPTLY